MIKVNLKPLDLAIAPNEEAVVKSSFKTWLDKYTISYTELNPLSRIVEIDYDEPEYLKLNPNLRTRHNKLTVFDLLVLTALAYRANPGANWVVATEAEIIKIVRSNRTKTNRSLFKLRRLGWLKFNRVRYQLTTYFFFNPVTGQPLVKEDIIPPAGSGMAFVNFDLTLIGELTENDIFTLHQMGYISKVNKKRRLETYGGHAFYYKEAELGGYIRLEKTTRRRVVNRLISGGFIGRYPKQGSKKLYFFLKR